MDHTKHAGTFLVTSYINLVYLDSSYRKRIGVVVDLLTKYPDIQTDMVPYSQTESQMNSDPKGYDITYSYFGYGAIV